MPQASRFAVLNTQTGQLAEQAPRVGHQFDGNGYSLQSLGAEVPLYSLGLSGTEWSVLDWIREHGGASAPIKVNLDETAADIAATPATVKAALARLVKLGLLLKPTPRGGAYQLTPLRYWEGAGYMQLRACRRMDPPRVTMDAKARKKDAKALERAKTKQDDPDPTPIRPRAPRGRRRTSGDEA
ncbi:MULTISPECIES: MarR family transcriptional regulator [unclassified Streptomyces]|uniref:MarR family transcriptional regulator n=1 Tax=unclassified Streptomyces TaxID=2593676 RepID=UPI00365EB854